MKIKKVYFSNKDLKTTQILVKNFFSNVGFKINKSGHGFNVSYGQVKFNPKALNPLRLKSKVSIEIKELEKGKTSINAEFIVDSRPNKILKKDKKYWEKFIRNFEMYIVEDKNTIEVSKEMFKQNKRKRKLSNDDKIERKFVLCFVIYAFSKILLFKYNFDINTELILTIFPWILGSFFILKIVNDDYKDKLKKR